MTRRTRRAPARLRSRRRKPPVIRWDHLLGFLIVAIPAGAWYHSIHRIDDCSPVSWQQCRQQGTMASR